MRGERPVHVICRWMAVLFLAGSSWAGERSPNVLFILSDNHSYYEVGFHGNTLVRTPHLDRLAEQSFEFTNWHADAFCSPSRTSLLSGMNAMRLGVYHTIAGRHMMPAETKTMAELLGRAGYATGIFGKWHLGDVYPFRPQDQGFKTTFYNEGLSLANPTRDLGIIRNDVTFLVDGKPSLTEGYSTDRIVDEAIKFMESNREQPFFCFVPTLVTHKQWQAPEGYAERYRGKVPDHLLELYGEIERLDEQVGRLLGAIDQLDLREDTIVVFMSDQGVHCNWHEGRGKPGQTTGPPKTHSVDGRHVVPFLIRQPSRIPVGKSDLLVWNPDLLPTVLDLCGVDPPKGLDFDGRSLRLVMENPDQEYPDRIIILQCPRKREGDPFVHAAIKTQRWRLMEGKRLSDAENDPLQMKDVSDEYPEVVARLRNEYMEWWKTVDEGRVPMARPVIGAEECPTTTLHAMLWHFGDSPWHPDQMNHIYAGGWKVRVAESGRYRIELRRYPESARKAIGATQARLEIGGLKKNSQLKPADTHADFEVELDAGDYDVKTHFSSPEVDQSWSAYFATFRKLNPVTL